MEDHVPATTSIPMNKPGTAAHGGGRTMTNFYPNHSSGNIQDISKRPTSAQVPRPKMVRFFVNIFYFNIRKTIC